MNIAKHIIALPEGSERVMNSEFDPETRLLEIHDELESIEATVEAEGRKSLTSEEKDRVEALSKEYDEVHASMESQGRKTEPGDPQNGGMPAGFSSSRKARYEMLDGTPIMAFSPSERISDTIQKEKEPLNLAKIILGQATGDFSNAPRELEAIRAQSVGTGSDGGWLAPQTVSANIIDTARNAARTIQAGADTIVMPSGEMTVVKVDTDPTPYWRKENAAITASSAVFGRILLVAQTIGCLIKVSEEMLQDALNADQLLRQLIGESIGLDMDRVALFGSGKSEPRGLSNTPNLGEVSMGTNGAALTDYTPFLDAIEDIETANGIAKSAIYAPRTKRAMAGLVTGISGDLTPLTPPNDFLELQRLTTNQVPINQTKGSSTNASCALVGDYSQMAFGIRQNLRLVANYGDDGFGKNQIHVRGTARMDIAVFRPTHFSKITGIIPA